MSEKTAREILLLVASHVGREKQEQLLAEEFTAAKALAYDRGLTDGRQEALDRVAAAEERGRRRGVEEAAKVVRGFRNNGKDWRKGRQLTNGYYDRDDAIADAVESLAPRDSAPADRSATLFDAIKHGDDKHRAWLKQAIEDHFAGRSVLRPDEVKP